MTVMLGGYLGTWPTSAVMLLLLLRRLQPDGQKAKGAKACATPDLWKINVDNIFAVIVIISINTNH